MATTERQGDAAESTSLGTGLVDALRGSALNLLVVFGAVEFAIAAALEAAMRAGVLERGLLAVWVTVLTIWGVGLMLVGVAGRLFIWWKRR